MVRRICFYHAGCPDGFGAAWAVRRAWGEAARYEPRGHDDELRARGAPRRHRRVRRHGARQRAAPRAGPRRRALVVLDHHVSSRDRFEADAALGDELRREGHVRALRPRALGGRARLAPLPPGREPLPTILAYVEDQDLWRFELPRSREVNAAVTSYPRALRRVGPAGRARRSERLADEGAPILRAQRAEVERALAGAQPVWIGGLRVEAVNAPFHRAQIGHELASARRPRRARRARSTASSGGASTCRSTRSATFDVSGVAARYGGGGHRQRGGLQRAPRDLGAGVRVIGGAESRDRRRGGRVISAVVTDRRRGSARPSPRGCAPRARA